jgi:UDP-N-acetylglucosamine 2-epimerase (non-hydrolysing)/GDP/UDP-N,N'-diacetylbacillosamine 2-epimerase (hydrolysing)
MSKRKICFVTGTRADYGLIRPVIKEVEQKANMDVSIIVSCMHLSKEFGYTVEEIKKDGFKIEAELSTNPLGDSEFDMAMTVGVGIVEIAKAYQNMKPDIVVLLGDRIEMLSAAITAGYMNIAIAHMHGGDISGNIDDCSRHSITKFAHLHLAATKKSAERIIKMGEEPWRVHIVGAPGIDSILNHKFKSKQEVCKELGLDGKKKILLVSQHSVTSQAESASKQIRETLEAVKDFDNSDSQIIVIYPNSDAGGRQIIKQIEEYEKRGCIKVYKSLEHDIYLDLLKNADVLVGNSSSGVIEAASFSLPVINIGIRQKGREKTVNVIDVPHDKEAIKNALKKSLSANFRKKIMNIKNPYGDGKTAQRIAKLLAEIKINNELLQKRITY